MPLNNLAVSSFPGMTGTFGDGAGVGDFSGISISIGVSGESWARCHCSREIQRRTIAVSTAESRTNAKTRRVLRRIFRTPIRLLFYPGDDRHDDTDRAQDRHQSSRHDLAGLHEIR